MFPKNDHLNVTIRLSALGGVWPLLSTDNQYFKKLYNFWSSMTFYYTCVYITASYVKLIEIIIGETDTDALLLVIRNLSVTLLNTNSTVRFSIIHRQTVKGMLNEILDFENKITTSGDKEVVKIYMEVAKQNKFFNKFYFCNGIYLLVTFFIAAKLTEISTQEIDGEIVTTRNLPVSIWFPLDEQKHFVVCYIYQLVANVLGGTMLLAVDNISFSMITFALGQLKVLGHVLRNFRSYADRVKDQLKLDSFEEASFVTVRECILKHNRIIDYVENINKTMKYITLFDFLQCSIQMTSVVLQLFLSELTLLNVAATLQFLVTMLIRLTIYYYMANEVIVYSEDISNAIYEMDWYEQSPKIKRIIHIILMRSQKCLSLRIGPFATMTLTTFVNIFPKNQHLDICIRVGCLVGAWPLIASKKSYLKQPYHYYSLFFFVMIFTYIASAYIKLFDIITGSSDVLQQTLRSLSVVLLNTIALARFTLMHKTTSKNMLQEIIDFEGKVTKSDDEELIKIYRDGATQNRFFNKVYLFNGYYLLIAYFVSTWFVEGSSEEVDGVTREVKNLPVSSWFPFDEQKHFLVAFTYQTIVCVFAATITMSVDNLTFSLITFTLCQLKTLVYILQNFKLYVSRVQRQLDLEDSEEANFVTLRECILRHKHIIKFVDTINKTMKNLMLFDFLQCSIQMASILIQLVVTELTVLNCAAAGQFIITMLYRLIVYYYMANEIIIYSVNVGNAIYEQEWYEQPTKIRRIVCIVIMRSQKPLKLLIGPFATMTLETFVNILRSTYSYTLLFLNTYNI